MIEITKWLVDALLTVDAIGTGQVKLSISSKKKSSSASLHQSDTNDFNAE